MIRINRSIVEGKCPIPSPTLSQCTRLYREVILALSSNTWGKNFGQPVTSMKTDGCNERFAHSRLGGSFILPSIKPVRPAGSSLREHEATAVNRSRNRCNFFEEGYLTFIENMKIAMKLGSEII